METQQVTNKSETSSKNSSEKSTPNSKNKKKGLPTTWSEILETNNPYIRFRQQVIATDHWPDSECNHCYGLGYIGTVTQEPRKVDKIGINRNKPCFCGSGKKFKRCCLRRVEEYKRATSSIVICRCVGSAQPVDQPSFGVEEMKNALKGESSED